MARHEFLIGGAGDYWLAGGDGADILRGGAGSDILDGGAGNDSLFIDRADTVVSGGAGTTQVFISDAGGATVNLGAGEIEEAYRRCRRRRAGCLERYMGRDAGSAALATTP